MCVIQFHVFTMYVYVCVYVYKYIYCIRLDIVLGLPFSFMTHG